MAAPLALGTYAMKKNPIDVIPPFLIIWLLAFIAKVLGAQTSLKSAGFGSTIWALLFGVAIVNIAGTARLGFLKPAMGQAEFYIKVGLVLLAVEAQELLRYGLRGILVSWLVSPVVVTVVIKGGMWAMDRGYAPPTTKLSLVVLLAVGLGICGGSAITAIGPIVGAPSEEVALAIAIVSLCATAFMIIQPYICIGAGVSHYVCGAWIGGSVDNTGNVVASAAIVSAEAEEVAAIIKMLQNVLIGFCAVAITAWWMWVQHPDGEKLLTEDAEDGSTRPTSRPAAVKKPPCSDRLILLWDRFPKFVLGFFILSLVITVICSPLMGERRLHLLLDWTECAANWWFAVGFVGIGLNTDVRRLLGIMQGGAPLAIYLVGQVFDIGLTFLVSWLAFRTLSEENSGI